jgi:hypothetical protein
VSVNVDGSTVSNSGVLDGSVSDPISLSRGGHTVSVSYSGNGNKLDTTVEWESVNQTKDPAIDVGGTTVYHSGLLDPGQTVAEPIDLSETSSTTISRTGGEHDAIVRSSWTEVAETQSPTVTINGEPASYSGTLAAGSSTSLEVSDNWIQEGTNTVDVDLDGSGNGGPEPQVGVSYSHTASTVAINETVNSSTWSEDVEVSRTFASDQSNVELGIGMPDNVVGVAEIEERRDGGNWSSVSSDRYTLDGTDLTVSMGDVAASESVEVRAVGDKTRVQAGAIEVLDPTLEGADLSTRMRVSDAAGTDPVAIEVSETAVGNRIHMVESAEWTSSAYHESTADGTETLYLPSAVAGANATIETAPLEVNPQSGDAETSIVNRSANRIKVEPGSSSGDELEIAYLDTESGQYYELYSVTEDRRVDIDQAESPAYFTTDDRSSTYLIQLTDPPGSSFVVAGDSGGGGGLPGALLLLAGIAGVGAVGLVSQRFGLGRRVTIPAAIVAAIGIAELGSSTSVLTILSNDLIRTSSTELIAAIATVGGLAGAWLLDRRTGIDVPTWLYGAIGIGGSAWLATSALGDAGSSVAALLVGGGLLVGLWAARRRFGLPWWLVAPVGLGALIFMLDSIAPGVLDELVVGPLSSGVGRIAPLVVIGGIIVLIVWLRRRGDSTEITLEVDEGRD